MWVGEKGERPSLSLGRGDRAYGQSERNLWPKSNPQEIVIREEEERFDGAQDNVNRRITLGQVIWSGSSCRFADSTPLILENGRGFTTAPQCALGALSFPPPLLLITYSWDVPGCTPINRTGLTESVIPLRESTDSQSLIHLRRSVKKITIRLGLTESDSLKETA